MISKGDDELLLKYLRAKGASKIDSIKIVRTVKSLSLKAADNLVHHSAAWADRRQSDEEELNAFLEDVGGNVDLGDLIGGKD